MSGKQNPQQNGVAHELGSDEDVEMWSAPTSNVRGVDEIEEVAMTVPSAPAINSMHVDHVPTPPPPPPKRSKCQRCSLMRSEPVCEPATGSKKCGKCYRDHRNCSWTTDTWELSSTTTPTSPRKRKPSPTELSNSDSSDLSPSPSPPLPKTPRRRVKKDRRGQPREINGKCVRCASFTNSPPCERSDDPTDLKCKKCRRDKQSCSLAPYYGRRKSGHATADDKDDETEDMPRRETDEEEATKKEQEKREETISKPEKAKEKRSESPDKARYNRNEPVANTYEREKNQGKEADNSKERKQEKDRAKGVEEPGDKAKEVAKPAEKQVDRDTPVKRIDRPPGKEKVKEKAITAEELGKVIFSERLKERENAKVQKEEVKVEKTKSKEKIGVAEAPKQSKWKEGQRDEGHESKRLKEGTVEKPTEGDKEKQKEGKDKKQKAVVAAKDKEANDRGKEKEKADESDAMDGKKRKVKEKVVESVATQRKKRKEMNESEAKNSKKGNEREKVDKSEAANNKKRKEKEKADEGNETNSRKRREQERADESSDERKRRKRTKDNDDRPTKKHKAHTGDLEKKFEENSASSSNGPNAETTLASPSKPNNVPRINDLLVPASVQGVASSFTQESEIAMIKNVDAELRAPSQTRLQSVEENQHRSLQMVARELSAAEFKASSHRALADSFLKDAERADQEVARLKEEMVSIVRKKVDFDEIERHKLIEVLGSRSDAP